MLRKPSGRRPARSTCGAEAPGHVDERTRPRDDTSAMKMHRLVRASVLAVITFLLVAPRVDAADVVQVNTDTDGLQNSVIVDCEPGGGYLVTWLDQAAPEPRTRRRRLALNGVPIGTEFAVANDGQPSVSAEPEVASECSFDPNDLSQFVVASWYEKYGSYCGAGGYTSTTYCTDYSRDSYVTIQRYARDGTPIGTEIVAEGPGNENQYPDAAMLPGSDFVVAWSTCYSYEGDYMARPCFGTHVVARAFESSGDARFDLAVSEVEPGYTNAKHASLSGHGDGSFTVVWNGPEAGVGNDYRILASHYEHDGAVRFEKLDVAEVFAGYFSRPKVAAGNGGDSLVAWDQSVASGDSDIFARRIGEPLPTDGCSAEPSPTCRPAAAGLGRLLLRAGEKPQHARRVRWTWAGRTPSADSFLDPRQPGIRYRLCLYDASTSEGPLSVTTVAGDDGGSASRWTRPRRRLYRYADTLRAQDGVSAMRLRAALHRTTRNKLHADGPGANVPSLPLQSPVVAQLFATDGRAVECWQAYYAAPQRNDGDVFRQRGASLH
jgi:hypothetical protein